MTEPTRSAGGPTATPAGRPDEMPLAEAVGSLCAYLASASGPWRGLEPSREHRCTAVAPPDPVSSETQRRYCLGPAHRACPVFVTKTQDAQAGRVAVTARPTGRRPFVATAPVVVERGSRPLPDAIRVRRRVGGQILAAVVVGTAVLAFLVAGPLAGPRATPSPSPAAVVATPTAVPTPRSNPSPSPGSTATPKPTKRPTPRPTKSPPSSGRTYTVRRGDTLSGIAAKFKTTVAVLVQLNGITNKGVIRVGQVLKLP